MPGPRYTRVKRGSSNARTCAWPAATAATAATTAITTTPPTPPHHRHPRHHRQRMTPVSHASTLLPKRGALLPPPTPPHHRDSQADRRLASFSPRFLNGPRSRCAQMTPRWLLRPLDRGVTCRERGNRGASQVPSCWLLRHYYFAAASSVGLCKIGATCARYIRRPGIIFTNFTNRAR
jgi:hypothetical protein